MVSSPGRPDQTFEIKVNDVSVKTGSLLTDFSPPVSPPAEIDDPTDFKPENWVESPKISDPLAVKPEEWDEDAPQYIVDEEAQVPADWLVNEAASVPDPEAEVRRLAQCFLRPVANLSMYYDPGSNRKSGLLKTMEIGTLP